MRRILIALLTLTFSQTSFAAPQKEWTFLIFLNGNNNLDSYGAMNLNQIEKIGSTAKINVVVQWASLANGKTQRLYMKKDNNTDKVTSPVIEDMGTVDMGDYHSVINFVKWGTEKYPAQHYFVDLWDHGSGWHFKQDELLKDISHDEISGHRITTKQLATALTETSKIIGKKIDIYGSDACLMAMIEVANEVNDSVSIFLGSQDTEPADGWPYDTFLAAWNKLPVKANAKDVAKVLTEKYAAHYKAQSKEVTLSAFDLNFLAPLNQSIKKLSTSFSSLSSDELKKINEAAKDSTQFYYDDYVDLVDFLDHLKSLRIAKLNKTVISEIIDNAKKFVVANDTVDFPKAYGTSIWIPSDPSTYSEFADRYSQLKFDHESHWGDVAKLVANVAK